MRHLFFVALASTIMSCSSDEFSSTDASSDVSSDLSVDASPVDAGASFCSAYPKATLCDDFDEKADGAGGFKPVYRIATTQGLLSLTDDYVSPAFGLSATIQPDSNESTAMLTFDTNKAVVTRVVVSAKVKLDANCDHVDGVTLLVLTGKVGANSGEFLGVNAVKLPDRSPLAFYDLVATPDAGLTPKLQGNASGDLGFGTWFDLVMDITFGVKADSGVTQTVVAVKWDGTTVYAGKVAGPASLDVPSMTFGASGTRSTTCTVHYDNVVIEMTP